jgi:hypothetical protein
MLINKHHRPQGTGQIAVAHGDYVFYPRVCALNHDLWIIRLWLMWSYALQRSPKAHQALLASVQITVRSSQTFLERFFDLEFFDLLGKVKIGPLDRNAKPRTSKDVPKVFTSQPFTYASRLA